MKKIMITFIFLILLTSCGEKMNKNNELVSEMQQIAIQHLKEEYDINFVVDRHKFLPQHVGPEITFFGHSKETPTTTYTVRVDYEDGKIIYASYNEHTDD